MKLAVIDRDAERRGALARDIARYAGSPGLAAEEYDSYEVFQGRFQGADIIFLSVESMNDVEAGRKLAQFFPRVPLVVASGSPEYSVEAFALGALDYLIYPLEKDALRAALARCGACSNAPEHDVTQLTGGRGR